MDLAGKARRVRIYVNEGDLVDGKPAFVAVVELLRREGAAGATVFRAVEGFGAAGDLHTERSVELLRDMPLVVEWIDSPERVERLAPRIEERVVRGLITVEDVEVLRFAPHAVHRVSKRLTAGEVMSRDVASVAPSTPMREVVERLLGKPYRAVPVVEGGRPVGIVTNGDLVARGGLPVRMELLPGLETPALHGLLARLAQGARTAGDVMTRAPVTVRDDASLDEVARVMAGRRLKRLPVVDGSGALVGIVSRVDLLRTVGTALATRDEPARAVGLSGEVALGALMRRDVPTLHPESELTEVMQAVIATHLDRAVVVDGERRVVGLVTDAELLERVTPSLRPSALRSLVHRLPFVHPTPDALAAEHHATARRAADLMRTTVPTARADTPLRDALGPMLAGKEKLLVIVDAEGRLEGVVDRADILDGLVRPR